MRDIEKLIQSGKLNIGSVLIWQRRSLKTRHRAVILNDGKLQTDDGVKHNSPSGAAKHLNGGKPVDGWIAWKLENSGISLAKLRENLQ